MSLLVPDEGVRLVATGSYLPETIVTSRALAARDDAPMTEAEIMRLTGIQSRRWVGDGQATTDLAVAAGRQLLQRAGWSSVDRLILSTSSPDCPNPASACRVQHQLGLAPCPAADVSAACAGFLFALDWGARAVLTGDHRVLILAADVRSRFVDPTDRATFALFGDGAGGLLLAPGPKEEGLVALYLAADGSGYESIQIPAGGSRCPASADTVAAGHHFIQMRDGPQVFLTAVEGMAETAEHLLNALALTLDDVDLVVPHQPNRMILDRLARYLRLPREKIFINVDHTGNMSSASVAVALDHAYTRGAIGPGSRVLLLGAGAGYCAGAALFKVPNEG